MKTRLFYAGWLLGLGGLTVVYFLTVPHWLGLLFENQAPAWFARLVRLLYPRFEAEQHRLPAVFFLQKAQHVGFRFVLLNGAVLLFHYLYYQQERFRGQVGQFWNQTTPRKNVHRLTFIFYAGLLAYTADFWWILSDLHRVEPFYKPVSFLRWLPFPSLPAIGWLLVAFYTCCVLVGWRKGAVVFSALAAGLFVYFQGLLLGFEKTDHTFATLTYALLLMPWLIRSSQTAQPTTPAWALQLIQLGIGLCYFQAGLEKLLVSGTNWFSADTLRHHLTAHPTPAGLWLAQWEGLCVAIQGLVLAFELGFVLAVFFPKLRWAFLPFGILFHLSTKVLLNVGGFFSPWVFVYVFFIDWSRLALPGIRFFRLSKKIINK